MKYEVWRVIEASIGGVPVPVWRRGMWGVQNVRLTGIGKIERVQVE